MHNDSLEAQLNQLLVATSDYGDDGLPVGLQDALGILRTKFSMDVVFVARIADGRREFMRVDRGPVAPNILPGMSDPVEQSWCMNIVRGRLPELIRDARPLIAAGAVPSTSLPIGTHLSVPVRYPDGSVYGTLCAFALHVVESASQTQVEQLRAAATMIGESLRA